MPAKTARAIKLDKATRDAKLDKAIARVKTGIADKKSAIDALPPKPRNAADRKTASAAAEYLELARLVLLFIGAADTTDITDGTGTE